MLTFYIHFSFNKSLTLGSRLECRGLFRNSISSLFGLGRLYISRIYPFLLCFLSCVHRDIHSSLWGILCFCRIGHNVPFVTSDCVYLELLSFFLISLVSSLSYLLNQRTNLWINWSFVWFYTSQFPSIQL